MADESVRDAARMIADAFVDEKNDSDLETAFGPDRSAPTPALQRLIAEHAGQHGLRPDEPALLAALREEFRSRGVVRPA